MSWPIHWGVTKLADSGLFSIENGLWTGEKEPLIECAVIRNTNFTNSGFLDLSNVAVICIEQRQLGKKKLQRGDIVVERSGGGPKQPVGRVAFFDIDEPDFCFSNFTSRIRVLRKDTIDPFFLHQYLFFLHASGQTQQLQRRTTGIRNLSFGDYISMPIPLPPLPEQRAIARVLRAVQVAREARQREARLERERKAALMDYLFTHGTRGEPTKQTPIGEMPESWDVVELGKIVAVRGGKRLPKGEDFALEPTTYPYIRVVDLSDGSVNTANLKYLTEEIQRLIARYRISKEDVYISIAGTIGLVGTIPPELDGANLTENAAKLVLLQSGRLTKDFLALYLSGVSGQNQIVNLTAKTTQPKLALVRIEQIRMPVPARSEQDEIAKTLRACDAKIAALDRESALLDELFRALLEELMSGRVSVSP